MSHLSHELSQEFPRALLARVESAGLPLGRVIRFGVRAGAGGQPLCPSPCPMIRAPAFWAPLIQGFPAGRRGSASPVPQAPHHVGAGDDVMGGRSGPPP